MIKQITWAECLTYLAIGLIIYYAVVIVLFYRTAFLYLLKGGLSQNRFDKSYPSTASASPGVSAPASESALYSQVLELMQDCKPVFKAAVEHSLEKSQIVEALQLRLKKYPQIIGTAFQVAVSNHIDQEIQNRCGLSLSNSDIETLWR